MLPATTDVLVVGAGPTGLTTAISLAGRGLDVIVADDQAEGANTSRAAVVHARTLEVLEPLGVSERLVAQGLHAPRFTIRDRNGILVSVRFDTLPTPYPYSLMISQAATERELLRRLVELGGHVARPSTLVKLDQDGDGVTAMFDDGSEISAKYLVGADGMHSTVRGQVGIDFDGGQHAESFSLTDVRLSDGMPADEVRLYFAPEGTMVVAPLPDGIFRIVAALDEAPAEPDIAFVQALLDSRGPSRGGPAVREVLWGSRFRVHHRVADTYRMGRVLLAGDAAHVHSPAGGQGMNTGILDAVALGGALAAALDGDETALDSYEKSRRPAAVKVVSLADRLTRLATVRKGIRPLRNLALRAASPVLRRELAWRLSGLVYR
ncbi:FAD-dependent oxidoreductase [Sphaerimonospora sp. CA-214678]|uniref:FAD-dependent oxidoreductase n=1 Tax=Sphaerimonospora sp. CA-214678 TaxID=3240029 RepID=UPI003D8BBFF6